MIHFDWAEVKLPCGGLSVSVCEGMQVDFSRKRERLYGVCVCVCVCDKVQVGHGVSH